MVKRLECASQRILSCTTPFVQSPQVQNIHSRKMRPCPRCWRGHGTGASPATRHARTLSVPPPVGPRPDRDGAGPAPHRARLARHAGEGLFCYPGACVGPVPAWWRAGKCLFISEYEIRVLKWVAAKGCFENCQPFITSLILFLCKKSGSLRQNFNQYHNGL